MKEREVEATHPGPNGAAQRETPAAGQASTQPRRRWDLQQTFAALRYPNYRKWFFGQMISLMGTWMQITAQGYLIFELTQSPAYLGYVGFAAGMPSWLFMLYGGVVADRIPRRKLLLITQSIMMGLALALAALTFAGLVQAWHVILLAFLLGTTNAFDAPARVSFVQELVDREDVTNAVALNGTMFNSAVVIGPAVAGLTYAALGPAWCFTLNGVSFLAVITALRLMQLPDRAAVVRRGRTLNALVEGLRYVAGHATIRTILTILATSSLFGVAFATLMPAWTVNVLGGGASLNGLLQSARGFGALVSALHLASLGRFQFRGRLLTVGAFVFPLMVIVFAAVRWVPAALAALLGVGWGMITLYNLSNALVQTSVPDELRGRVMSIYTLTIFGLMPIGSLLHGQLAARAGEPATVALGGLVMLAVATLVYWRAPQLRRMP